MEHRGEENKGYLCAVMSAGALSLTGICISYLSRFHHLEPVVLAFWRNAILVGLLVLILELAYPMLVEISRKDALRLAGVGLTLALFNYLWTLSVALNGAAVATFLVYSSVPFTALLGRLCLGEKNGSSMSIAIALVLCGCLLLSVNGTSSNVPITRDGIAIGLGSGLLFAVYSLFGRSSRKSGLNSWTIMLYSFLSAAVVLFLSQLVYLWFFREEAGLSASFFSLGTSLPGWGVLVFLAVGPTLVGFGLYNVSLGYLPTAVVNLITTLEPAFTAAIAYFLLGEKLSPGQLLGGGLILCGVVFFRLMTSSLDRSLGFLPGRPQKSSALD